MLGLTAPGSRRVAVEERGPTRKYPHTWEMVEADLGSGADARRHQHRCSPTGSSPRRSPSGGIKKLAGYETLRREVKYGEASRIDILLEDGRKGRCYVEVKNVHLMRAAGRAEFPDCVTTRGAKHLRELAAMVAQGHRAVMLYLIQRADAESFSIADDFDPRHTRKRSSWRRTQASRQLLIRCRLSPEEITVDKAVRDRRARRRRTRRTKRLAAYDIVMLGPGALCN